MKIELHKSYKTRSGRTVTVSKYNTERVFDGLPWIIVPKCESIADALGIGAPSWYTVDHNGRVYPDHHDPYDLIEQA